jgi:hypothetical protein
LCPFYHLLVEDCSTDAKTGSSREAGLHKTVRVQETDPPQNLPISWTNRHAQLAQRRHGARHQSFATRFVDGRLRAVRDGYLETFFSRSNRTSQSSGTSANHKYIYVPTHLSPRRTNTDSQCFPPVRCKQMQEDVRCRNSFVLRQTGASPRGSQRTPLHNLYLFYSTQLLI